MNFPEDDGTDEGGIVRCECGRAAPCRHCPTPIDPADIRPGDVFRLTHEATCKHVQESGIIIGTNGYAFDPRDGDGATWHLVSSPARDAEAVQAIRSASYNIRRRGERMDPLPGLTESLDLLAKLREQGWDVVRRAES